MNIFVAKIVFDPLIVNRLTAIFFLFCFSTSALATDLADENDNEKSNQDFSYGKHTTPGSATDDTLHDNDDPNASPTPEALPANKKNEADSSTYSVNKFNFLFYFVYKLKYLDEEMEDEDSEQTIIKK